MSENINFLQDLIDSEILKLQEENISYDQNLAEQDPVSFLASCIEFSRRRISQVPRIVHISSDLKASHLYSKFQTQLSNLINLFSTGGDVLPFQTRRIGRFDEQDLLLNDWRIHHLHLGQIATGANFSQRTSELLFLILDKDDCYLIDILDHSSFTELGLLETIEKSWPHLLDQFTQWGIKDLSFTPTPVQLKELRAAGVLTMVKLQSGRILAPIGGGYSTIGTSVACMSSAQNTANILYRCEEFVLNNIVQIQRQLKTQSSNLKLASLEKDGFSVFANDTDAALKIAFSQIHDQT